MAYTELQKQQHIRELQGYLHGISHIQQLPHVIPDGIYGEKTIEAIRQFQQQNHMPATGETDTATWNAVAQAYLQEVRPPVLHLALFPTGITAYDHEPLFTADMLVYGGRYYLIGEGHKEFAPDKIKDEDYYVLTLAAIAKELKAENLTEAHIVIAAGLPLTWTSGQKADFRAYLMKNAEVEFVYKKTAYHLYIDDVRIYPQGYAVIASFATTLKGVNLIADIGNGTMNTLYMINGKPQQGKMFTEKFGTYQCTLAVREAFMQKTQREINDDIIDEVLITGTANIAPADLKIIKSVAAEYVRDIFRRLREHGYDENTMPCM